MGEVQPKKVLIVDDEPDICFLLSNMLKQKHYEVAIANTLGDGMKQLANFFPSILFLDIHLPDGSGLDSIRLVKRDFPKTKIIIMSAYDGSKERNRAKSEGADLFISKPLNHESVLQTIDEIQRLYPSN